MNTYPHYKPSGIQWIGEIPEHWEVKKLKYIPSEEPLSFIDGDWIESKDIIFEEGIRYITTGNIGEGKYKEQGHSFITPETFIKLNCTEVFPGDLLISRLNNPIGRSCIIPDLGFRIVTSVDNVIFRPNESFSKLYLNFLMNNSKYYEFTELIARGATMQRISRGLLAEVKLPVPPLSEQTAIANYLDRKTAEIDQTIADKEALIGLYEEEKKGLINEAVTKGLNPNVPLKPSGIEWLEEIPVHWRVKRLKYLSEIKTGEKNTDDNEEEGEYPFFVRSQTIQRISTYSFDGEAILTAGDGVGVAKVFHYINGKFDYHQRVYKISHFKEIIGKFLFHYLVNNLYKEVLKVNAKSTVDSLRLPMFQNFLVAIPPLPEQAAIVDYIETETAKINEKMTMARQEIELLKEFRQALIFECVTGKVCCLEVNN